MPKPKKMLKEVSWEKFQEDGMVWLVNRMLHLFGYALVVEETSYKEVDNNIKKRMKLIRVYPAKCKFRGFPEDAEDRGFRRVTKYMRDNHPKLMKDLDA